MSLIDFERNVASFDRRQRSIRVSVIAFISKASSSRCCHKTVMRENIYCQIKVTILCNSLSQSIYILETQIFNLFFFYIYIYSFPFSRYEYLFKHIATERIVILTMETLTRQKAHPL